MSAVQFTPGPWEVGMRHGLVKTEIAANAGHRAVATVWTHRQTNFRKDAPYEIDPEGQANARLIAAAPTAADYIRRKAEAGDEEAQQIWEMICGRG